MTFGERVRDLREDRGWSISDLGRHVGSRSYAYQLETDVSSPTLGKIEQIADAFGLSVLELLAPLYETDLYASKVWEEWGAELRRLGEITGHVKYLAGQIMRAEAHRLVIESEAASRQHHD